MTKKCESFEAKIFVGLRAGYTDKIHDLSEAEEICQKFVNDVSLCVTVTPTTYIYKDGKEPGFIVGLINYPRFPDDIFHIKLLTLRLAKILMTSLEQLRCTVYFPDMSILLENKDLDSNICYT